MKAFPKSTAQGTGELTENWRKVYNGYLKKAVSCVKYNEPTSHKETTLYTKAIMNGMGMKYTTSTSEIWASHAVFLIMGLNMLCQQIKQEIKLTVF